MTDRLNAYQRVNEAIQARLAEGVLPWARTWGLDEHGDPIIPRNLKTRKPYHGVNRWVLGSMPYDSPFWLTFKQAKDMGGSVRKGERGTPGVFWKILKDETVDPDTGKKLVNARPLLRHFTVFNVAQIDGIPYPDVKPVEHPAEQRIESAERLIAKYNGAPRVDHRGNQPCYRPVADVVELPHVINFNSAEHYYSTLFHELAHSTGHQSRLNRLKPARFGSHSYSQEELVAEMAAAYMCGICGIDSSALMDNSAAYLEHWSKRLREKDAERWLVTASAQADKAVRWIQNDREKISCA